LGSLQEGTNQGPFAKLGLVVVAAMSARINERRVDGMASSGLVDGLALQHNLGLPRAPRLCRDPAERDARTIDNSVGQIERDRSGSERKLVRFPVTDFQI